MNDNEQEVLDRELAYHEKLYGGFAQSHFARPAVRALRANMVTRIRRLTNLGKQSRVLSLGCGIGDTELLLAPHVGELVGVDLSPTAIQQARQDADKLGVSNARFLQGTATDADGDFDAIIAIFFLHHLSDLALGNISGQVSDRLKPGGWFYSLDPSENRLSGKVGQILFPQLMKKYQTEDERELDPEQTRQLFAVSGRWSEVRVDMYDFGSSPAAGLFPGWGAGYKLARWADNALLRSRLLARYGSNFEIISQK